MRFGRGRDTSRSLLKSGLTTSGLVLILSGFLLASGSDRPVYATWQGVGPDKWASAWLITHRIDDSARIEFLPPGATIRSGIGFDVPDAEFMRNEASTTFEQLVDAYNVLDPSVLAVARIVRGMEIGAWSLDPGADAGAVERGFRELQLRYGREGVPFGCYMAFFDALYTAVQGRSNLRDSATLDVGSECVGSESGRVVEPLVPELPAEVVLARIGRGERVLFVDAREDAEFAEYRIPGAFNVKLREVDAELVAGLRDYDLVVPYCVKDFRGYEVARAMQKLGLEQVAIMNPFGIRGWRDLGLPLAGEVAAQGAEALVALERCAADVPTCLRSS